MYTEFIQYHGGDSLHNCTQQMVCSVFVVQTPQDPDVTTQDMSEILENFLAAMKKVCIKHI